VQLTSHLAVKLATTLGAEVTVFTTSPDKATDARRFGAKDVVINADGADFSKLNHVFDFALDTVPYKHDLNRFIPLLKREERVGKPWAPRHRQQRVRHRYLPRKKAQQQQSGQLRKLDDPIVGP
jgi:D-arabinose 1-dehydrogenase-like Zn-dependent alcohol dehydrogenase